MNKLSKLTLWIIIAIFALALTYLLVYVSVNDIDGLRLQAREDRETIENLEDLVDKKDFAWVACDLEIDNLEQIIASKDDLIIELQVQVDTLPLYKETLQYYVSYIRLCQTTMIFNGLSYPEFVYDTILEEGYFEDIEEQVEWFEGIEE